MADTDEGPIVLVHPKLEGAEYTAVNENQAAVLELSGWKRQSKAAAAAAAKNEEK